MGRVLAAIEASESNLNIVVLDCCRNNPFKRSWSRSTSPDGLAAVSEPPEGILIAFATGSGETASDGREINSPYTRHLTEVLKSRPSGGLEIVDVFRTAGVRVKKELGQVPWVHMPAFEKYYLWRANRVTTSVAKTEPSSRPSGKPISSGAKESPTLTLIRNLSKSSRVLQLRVRDLTSGQTSRFELQPGDEKYFDGPPTSLAIEWAMSGGFTALEWNRNVGAVGKEAAVAKRFLVDFWDSGPMVFNDKMAPIVLRYFKR